MNKLISAEFHRLFTSLIFRICLLISAAFSAFVILMRWSDVRMHPEEYAKLGIEYSNADGLIFVGGLYIVFVIAVFVGIFVGTEYSDGTIRNKLTAGHTRGSIYLSKLIVCAVADGIIHMIYILIALLLGTLLIHGTTMTAKEILLFTLVSTTAVLATTAMLLLFSMSIQSKAVGSIVCLLSIILMLFSALTIRQRLDAPEYYEDTYIDGATGEIIETESEKNPRYLTGTKRKVYEFLDNFIPVSQIYQIVMNLSDNLRFIVIYDGVIILITTGAGVAIFQKKNLK